MGEQKAGLKPDQDHDEKHDVSETKKLAKKVAPQLLDPDFLENDGRIELDYRRRRQAQHQAQGAQRPHRHKSAPDDLQRAHKAAHSGIQGGDNGQRQGGEQRTASNRTGRQAPATAPAR